MREKQERHRIPNNEQPNISHHNHCLYHSFDAENIRIDVISNAFSSRMKSIVQINRMQAVVV